MKLHRRIALAVAGLGLLGAQVAFAQVETIDPNAAIDSDLNRNGAPAPAARIDQAAPVGQEATGARPLPPLVDPNPPATSAMPAADQPPPPAGAQGAPAGTYKEDDLIGAAEGVFGKGARGLALMIRDVLKKQGEPIGYITGREAGGAFVVGVRYGSGTLHHKIEGERPVYWTGPSVGLDLGANAGNTFVLVYNLHDSEDLFHRFGAGEGQAYLIGGFNVSYIRRNDVVLIPVRMGAGLRLGVNAGYMKFSRKQNWMPF
ncbi:DUF1134 domain-containing protein [Novosphingobium sp. KCTC 2891]|uniref:DUF1134 domain-containing protein n=1 Tax=Novosphingobium sp. KCTC 2891 TaxID=2989730 RepID=UPI0022235D8F|nr:DUF1134 domain-containing protein [Novosphingobium sp. KCTC 2891]MCW1383936.1 DUF1134 domain-containing protein [Novosphingobium sp. KCTC 2891]